MGHGRGGRKKKTAKIRRGWISYKCTLHNPKDKRLNSIETGTTISSVKEAKSKLNNCSQKNLEGTSDVEAVSFLPLPLPLPHVALPLPLPTF